MATYLIDCGPGGDLVELGRRVVSYLGPDAMLARTHDILYGGVDTRSSGADVFIGLQSTGTMATETWVHPRSGPRSRVLADSIQAEMWRYGARGGTRTGDLSALAPERHLPNAAACLVEVDDRVRHTREPRAIDEMAQVIANAARGARFGGRGAASAAARGFDAAPAVENPLMQPFADLVARARTDSAYRERAHADPIAALRELGVEVPADIQDAMATHLRGAISGPAATTAGWARGLSAAIEVNARPWGVVISLDSQTTSDLANGTNVVAGILTAIAGVCTATGNVPCAAVSAILSGYLWAMASLISLMNRGNGVYLTIPWTSFLPAPFGTPGLVIPTPR
jgi:hypothetical protein